MTRVRHKGVRPGWYVFEDGDVYAVISYNEKRAVQMLDADTQGPGGSPAFQCFFRAIRSLRPATVEFDTAGWVTGYAYAEEWLEGGNPGMILESSIPYMRSSSPLE